MTVARGRRCQGGVSRAEVLWGTEAAASDRANRLVDDKLRGSVAPCYHPFAIVALVGLSVTQKRSFNVGFQVPGQSYDARNGCACRRVEHVCTMTHPPRVEKSVAKRRKVRQLHIRQLIPAFGGAAHRSSSARAPWESSQGERPAPSYRLLRPGTTVPVLSLSLSGRVSDRCR